MATARIEEIKAFVDESKHIEGIESGPTDDEIAAAVEFLAKDKITLHSIIGLMEAFEPEALFRNRTDVPNVVVGNHQPPPSGPNIESQLRHILEVANRATQPPHIVHWRFLYLHPFTDGNGRTARMLWAWQMLAEGRWPGLQLGFLHTWYYQTLGEFDASKK